MAKAGRLWNYFDGEPFLDNPPLAIVSNPKKKGKTTHMAKPKRKGRKNRPMPAGLRRYWAKHRRKARKNPRRPRRNAFPIGGVAVAANPKHRHSRRSHARRNPRRHVRRHYRRNPAVLGIELPPLQSVLYAGAGFIVPPYIEGMLMPYLPISMATSTVGKYAVRIASVLGLSWLAKQVIGAQEAKMVAIGGGAYVLTTAVAEFAPDLLPRTSTAPVGGLISPAAVGSYVKGVGSYVTPAARQLGAPTTFSRGLAPRFPVNMPAAAQRFKRF
jgi:hypothetical protein